VAYSESEEHILKKVKDYWLGNLSRVHDAIVVKIDKVPPGGQIPLRMQVSYIYSLSAHDISLFVCHFKEFNPHQAWHFCVRDRPRRTADIQPRTYVMS